MSIDFFERLISTTVHHFEISTVEIEFVGFVHGLVVVDQKDSFFENIQHQPDIYVNGGLLDRMCFTLVI